MLRIVFGQISKTLSRWYFITNRSARSVHADSKSVRRSVDKDESDDGAKRKDEGGETRKEEELDLVEKAAESSTGRGWIGVRHERVARQQKRMR